MLWEDLEPGDKLMFNPEWIKHCSYMYGWWGAVRRVKDIKLEIKFIEISRNDDSNLTIIFKKYDNDGFSIKRETGRTWDSLNRGDNLPLFKIVELKGD